MNEQGLLENSSLIIDSYEIKGEDGTVRYVDEVTYADRLQYSENQLGKNREQLRGVLRKIRKNNPLNIIPSKMSQSERIGDVSLADYDDERIVPNVDGTILIDDFLQVANKMGQPVKETKRFSLKRVAATLGVAIGITAAVAGVSNYILNHNNTITIESPTKENPDITNYHDGIEVGITNQIKARKDYSIDQTEVSSVIRLGDKIQLKDTKLYYDSNYQKPCVKTKKLLCDYYKINHIAVLSNNGKKVLKNVEVNSNNKNLDIEEFKEYCRLLYGDNIKFQMDVDGFIKGKRVYVQTGWTSTSNIQSRPKRKVFKKAR